MSNEKKVYFLARTWDYALDDGPIQLGNIIVSPTTAADPLNTNRHSKPSMDSLYAPILEHNLTWNTEKHRSGQFGIWTHFLWLITLERGMREEYSDDGFYQFERIETREFIPTVEYLREQLAAPMVARYLERGQPVYMITAVKAVYGARARKNAAKHVLLSPDFEPFIGGVRRHHFSGGSRFEGYDGFPPFVFAFRLRKVILRQKDDDMLMEEYTGSAMHGLGMLPFEYLMPFCVEKVAKSDASADEFDLDDAQEVIDDDNEECTCVFPSIGRKPATQFLSEEIKRYSERVTNPIETIEQALERQDLRGLRTLLAHNFMSVTEGYYRWLRELSAVGYSHDAMAQLLFEAAADAPWIVFEPHNFVKAKPTIPFHYSGCAHHQINEASSSEVIHTRNRVSEPDVSNTVQELCGLGGILPISQDQNQWNGQCSFQKEDNSVALLTYNMSSDAKTNHWNRVIQILKALDGFCTAAAHLQKAGLCCDSFTVVRKRDCAPNSEQLELVRVEFDKPVSLYEEVQKLKENTLLTADDVQPCSTIAREIIELLDAPYVDAVPLELAAINSILPSHGAQPTTQSSESYQQQFLDDAFHVCALAAQLLCLGLASFLQAHVGHFEPFFLNAELKKILLFGNVPLPQKEKSLHLPLVRVDLNELKCLSGMTGGPVLAFSLVSQQFEEALLRKEHHRDLVCRIDGLLETWGPGHCIPFGEDENKVKAIELRGGLVYAVDVKNCKFHWESGTAAQGLSTLPSFDRDSKMVIGALVTENLKCEISEQQWDECREKCSSCLIPLGTHRSYWKLGELQSGFQCGHSNAMFSYSQTSIKRDGKAVKETKKYTHDDVDLLNFLEWSCGLQVSYCTGVARRVPLKALVADLLPVFAKAENQSFLLQDWINRFDVLRKLELGKVGDVMQNVRNSDKTMYESLIKYMRKILDVLEPTGLEMGHENLVIAWPHESDLMCGVRIPCTKQSYWARILADSHHCATYAYITKKCLESDPQLCKGASRLWTGTTAILETAVSCYSVRQQPSVRSLEDGKFYHLATLDSLILLRAVKDDQKLRLMVTESTIPRFFQKILLVKPFLDQEAEIREKQRPDCDVQQVLVCAGDRISF